MSRAKHVGCKCPPASPFRWREQPCELDWGQLQRSAETSAATSLYVNTQRGKGIEPGAAGKGTPRDVNPKQFHIYSRA